jgi:hypothetical protein
VIPVGYMAMRIAARPDSYPVKAIVDIYSVSGCISRYFADFIRFWAHNGQGLFDSPKIIRDLAAREKIDLSSQTFFYYEAYEREYDVTTKKWSAYHTEPAATAQVQLPVQRALAGFDVVTFAHGNPEHSPLSCNLLSAEFPVNDHCLLRSLEEAKASLESGRFDNSEPGPFRIFAVYTVA